MYKTELMKLKFKFPTLPEQQKISTFLTALDRQIEQVGQQIEGMQGWKQGLLQKMFV